MNNSPTGSSMVSAFSFVLLFPMILPTPWSAPYGVDSDYRFEITDKHGKIYLQTGEKKEVVKYKSYFMFPALNRGSHPPQFVYDEAYKQLLLKIKSTFIGNN